MNRYKMMLSSTTGSAIYGYEHAQNVYEALARFTKIWGFEEPVDNIEITNLGQVSEELLPEPEDDDEEIF